MSGLSNDRIYCLRIYAQIGEGLSGLLHVEFTAPLGKKACAELLLRTQIIEQREKFGSKIFVAEIVRHHQNNVNINRSELGNNTTSKDGKIQQISRIAHQLVNSPQAHAAATSGGVPR